METFKEVSDNTDYLISDCGRVKTKKRKLRYVHYLTGKELFRETTERLVNVYENKYTGYKFVSLRLNKKQVNRTIHRLVAEAFIENQNNFSTVNHKDGNKHNNTVENLEWCTNEYNHHHATITGLKARGEKVGSSKLNTNSVHAIKYLLNKGFSHVEISIAFKVSRATISLISENKTWKHVSLTGEEITIYEPSVE